MITTYVNRTKLALIHFTTEWPEAKLTVVAKGVFDTTGTPAQVEVDLGVADLVPVKPKVDVTVRDAGPGQHRVRLGDKRVDAPNPEALLPLPLEHPERLAKLGTFDQAWLDERWPYYPADLDTGYFNAAPPALQLDALRGDEQLIFNGAGSQLPGLRLRALLQDDGGTEELQLTLDTLELDVESGLYSLTWRGFADLGEHTVLYLASESLADDPQTLEHHDKELQLALLAQQGRAPRKRPSFNKAKPANENEPNDAEELANLRKSMEEMNAPPELLEKIDEADNMDQALVGMMDMIDGDPAEIDKALKACNARMKKQLEDAGEDASAFDDPIEEEKDTPIWTRKRVQACAANGESMEGADLRKLDLSELDLSGAKLGDAILTGVSLHKTILYNADLNGATLAKTDLREAVLNDANLADTDLTAAKADKAGFRSATLTGALFVKATLTGACFDEAKAAKASFLGADLTSASFIRADLTGARVDEAIIHGVSFEEAVLEGAMLDGSRGDEVSFLRANMLRTRVGESALLYKADLRHAKADESIWHGADLREATLTLSEMRRADLSGANLEQAKFDGVDSANADFTGAKLTNASLLGSNFAGACFTKADLSQADARKANFYEAELWQCITTGTRLDEAHLVMTKLAPKEVEA